MEKRKLTYQHMAAFEQYLISEERCTGTVEKYLRDVGALYVWAKDQALTRELVLAWKEHLVETGYATSTVNSMLAAVNTFFKFMNWSYCRVKFLKVQKKMFRDPGKELTHEEYRRLVDTAGRTGRKRLALLIETIGATGIRVSEVPCITVEAAVKGSTEISLKGKIRRILLPGKLCRKLLKYARKNKIPSGEIFITRSGKGLTRKQIWAEMKKLCYEAGVEPSKVFPHNLRHLFAAAYYRHFKDISSLADILGHSSVETTRIYLLTSGEEHIRRLEGLGLVS